METRPVIKLNLSTAEKFIEWLGWILLSAIWMVTIFNYANLPETIPFHWNAKGEVDNYAGRQSIFILPVIGSFIFTGMTVLNNYPHIFNYAVKIDESNAARQYTNATRLIRVLKSVIVLVFLFIIIKIIHSANNADKSLDAITLPLIIGIIVIPVIFFIFNSFRTKNKSAI